MMYSPHFSSRLIRGLTLFSLLTLVMISKPETVESQVLRVLTNNTFSGTINGAVLGGATMALANSDDFSPVRVGVGLGTLTGIGIGIYDASNQQGYVQGTFNTVSNSGYIILVDTFYGAATGAVVGVAVALLGNNRIVVGAQYGVGAGAWAGFTFGLVDAFYLSHNIGEVDYFSSHQDKSGGLLNWSTGNNSQVDFLNPAIYTFTGASNEGITLNSYLGMELAKVSVRF